MTPTLPTLESERLRFRPVRPDDAEAFLSLYPDAAQEGYLTMSESVADERAAIERHIATYYAERGYGMWAVELLDGGELVGRAGFLDVKDLAEDGWGGIEFLCAIGPAHRRRGYAREAARRLFEWMHDERGVDEILAIHHHENFRTRTLLQAWGLEPDARLERTGVPVDVYRIGLPWIGPDR